MVRDVSRLLSLSYLVWSGGGGTLSLSLVAYDGGPPLLRLGPAATAKGKGSRKQLLLPPPLLGFDDFEEGGRVDDCLISTLWERLVHTYARGEDSGKGNGKRGERGLGMRGR